MHRTFRRIAGAGAAAIAVGLLSACATDTAAGGPAASNDPVTFVCNVQDDWCQVMSDAFTADTGIPARFVRINTGETLARLQAASAAPEFDVWVGGNADSHIAAWDEGLLAAYESPVAEAIDPDYRDPDGHWTGLYLGALSFCSNTEVLSDLGVDVPTTWDDLLDPALKSQVALAHPSTSGTSYTALWTQVELNDGDEDAALDYFAKLNQNILQYPKTGGAPGQMAGRGEVAVGIVFAHDCQQYINEGFSALEVAFPEEGTGFEIGAISVVADGPNESGAHAFVDWALSPEAQALGETASAFQIPSNPETPVSENMVDLGSLTLVPYDAVAAGAMRAELTARFDNEIATAPRE
ncbi:ABC transporter substrate-binding protein [Agromyces silvae]|uniref:ABC transporter substrate-binding protein n=1 Tax=Agromyces silvae TaxID=3388266 RepID=UPI00280BE6C9|nr:ABC transporter substrate-binding protein [Agromyces protaetiae]